MKLWREREQLRQCSEGVEGHILLINDCTIPYLHWHLQFKVVFDYSAAV